MQPIVTPLWALQRNALPRETVKSGTLFLRSGNLTQMRDSNIPAKYICYLVSRLILESILLAQTHFHQLISMSFSSTGEGPVNLQVTSRLWYVGGLSWPIKLVWIFLQINEIPRCLMFWLLYCCNWIIHVQKIWSKTSDFKVQMMSHKIYSWIWVSETKKNEDGEGNTIWTGVKSVLLV